MAHIEKRNRGGRTSWRARYRRPTARERSRSFAKKSDAEQWLDAVRRRPRARHVRRSRRRQEALRRVRARMAGDARAPTVDRGAGRLALANPHPPELRGPADRSIRRSEIQAFVKELSTKMQPSTVEVVYRHPRVDLQERGRRPAHRGVSRAIASRCRRSSAKRVDPARDRRRARDRGCAPRPLPGARHRSRPGPGCGRARRSGSRSPNVDFLRRRLDVVQQLVLVQNRPPFLAPAEDGRERPHDPAARRRGRRARPSPRRFPAGRRRVRVHQRARRADPPHPLLRPRGARPPSASHAPQGTSFHSLRHYYASLLIRHGESVKVVQARLGHASAAETLDTYSHLWPDSEDQTRGAVDACARRSRGLAAARRSRRDPRIRRSGPWWWRVGLYAGFCAGAGRRWRPSISAGGYPPAPAAYPGVSAGGPALPLLGLAPGGVYRATRVTPGAGALLPHRFTLTCAGRPAIGGLFSVALSCGSPRLGVTQHPALWSPDVPRTGHRPRHRGGPVRGRLADSPPAPSSRVAPTRTFPVSVVAKAGASLTFRSAR